MGTEKEKGTNDKSCKSSELSFHICSSLITYEKILDEIQFLDMHTQLPVKHDWIIVIVAHQASQMGFSCYPKCQESIDIFMELCDIFFSFPVSTYRTISAASLKFFYSFFFSPINLNCNI